MTLAAPASTAADTAALADALRPVLLRLSRQLRRQSETLGLSPIETLLLGTILTREGVGLSELADLEQMSRPAMSAHIKRLEAGGYIARQAADPADKRRVGLVVTEAGRKARDAVRRRRNDWLARKLAGLSPQARGAVQAAIAPLAAIAGERL